MTNPKLSVSPQLYARIGGLLYLFNILAGMFGELFVRGHLVIAGDAVATAHNISASNFLFRSGIAGDLLMHVSDVPLILIFYVLLKPVSKDLALLAALFNLVQTAVLVANKLTLLAVLVFLGNADYLKAFDPHQLQALADASLTLHEYGFAIGLVFFGFTCLVTGHLMIRSGYFPKTLGVLQGIAGLCYLINSFALFLAPTLAAKMFPTILLPAFIGELSTCLWLLIKGVNLTKWNQQLHMASTDFSH
ncbi:MAG: DUF4386 domain-containing protein [Candidatus Acidiferrum sp.]|jgi:hypothetical protein